MVSLGKHSVCTSEVCTTKRMCICMKVHDGASKLGRTPSAAVVQVSVSIQG